MPPGTAGRHRPVQARPVVTHHRQAVAAAKTQLGQATGDRADLVGHFGPGVRLPDAVIFSRIAGLLGRCRACCVGGRGKVSRLAASAAVPRASDIPTPPPVLSLEAPPRLLPAPPPRGAAVSADGRLSEASLANHVCSTVFQMYGIVSDVGTGFQSARLQRGAQPSLRHM